MSAKNTLLDFPPYLDCPKPDSDEVRYSKMSDTRLCSELDKIWKKQKELKEKGLLTRDSRMKERKKYGLKKARKSSQFSKR